MKRLFVGVVLAALCGAPGLSRADAPGETRTVTVPARDAQAGRVPAGDAEEEIETSDLEEREKAAPQLAEFSGGADGVYITSGAILVALIVVLLLVAL